MSEGLKKAVDQKVINKYIELLNELIEMQENRIEEGQKVITQNEVVKKIVEKSDKADDPDVKESLDGFAQVIEQTKLGVSKGTLQLEAATRLKETLIKNKPTKLVDFLVDFDKISGIK